MNPVMGNCSKKLNWTSDEPKSSLSPQIYTDHQGSINCLATNDNGQFVVTGSDDCTARIWTPKGPDGGYLCTRVLRGHEKYIRCVCIHNDHVVTGSADGTLRKWNLTSGHCVHVYHGHTDAINRMICTKNFILSSSRDSTARCWRFDAANEGADEDFCLKIFKGHTSAVFPLIYMPLSFGDNRENGAGATLITGSADCTARVWSVSDGKCLRKFVGHTDSIQCLSVDQYGKILFTGSADRTIRSWDMERTGDVLRVFEGHEQAVLSILTINRTLYSGGADGNVKSWVIDFGDCTRTLKCHSGGVGCMVYENGFLFIGCGQVVHTYDRTGSLKFTFKSQGKAVNCLRVADGKLFTGSADGIMHLWSLREILK